MVCVCVQKDCTRYVDLNKTCNQTIQALSRFPSNGHGLGFALSIFPVLDSEALISLHIYIYYSTFQPACIMVFLSVLKKFPCVLLSSPNVKFIGVFGVLPLPFQYKYGWTLWVRQLEHHGYIMMPKAFSLKRWLVSTCCLDFQRVTTISRDWGSLHPSVKPSRIPRQALGGLECSDVITNIGSLW